MDKTSLTSWGNVRRSESFLREPASAEETRKAIMSLGKNGGIARGSGRSYGDQAMNEDGDVIRPSFNTTRWSNVNEEGVVTVKSSVTFFELLKVLVPLGWYLPVVPGTGFVTIGGAIAADIHGKNHYHKSSLGNHVRSITLMLADGNTVECSRINESELFWATVGGLGLTGVILEAKIQLTSIPSSTVLINTKRFYDFAELLEVMKSTAIESDYSIAWLDLISKSNPGRGILETGNYESTNEDSTLSYETKPLVSISNKFPNTLLNASTVRIYSALRFNLTGRRSSSASKPLATYMHPLDRIGNWNRLYGPAGLIQWQVVIPEESEDALLNILQAINKSDLPAFLAVLKKLGPANNAALSFPLRGWTLAVDFPAKHHLVYEVLDALDLEVVNVGGRVYLAKDTRLDSKLISKMYPRVDEWNSIRETVDPHRRWQSDFSRRLGL